MSKSSQSFAVAILPIAIWLVTLAVPAFAQQPASNSNSIYDEYYATSKTLQQQHQQKLAEIDESYATALREYSAENIRRAQALTDQNTAEHKALGEKGLKGDQRQAEYDRIQAENTKRRAEYAEWRDGTARRLRDEHAAARTAEIERHKAETSRLLADRNANLARNRALDGSIGLTPGASAALDQAVPPDSGPAPEAVPDDAGSEDSESAAEVDVDGLEMLERANDGQAGIGTPDDGSDSDSGSDDDLPTLGRDAGGLGMLGRADESDNPDEPSDPGDDAGDAVPALPVSGAAARDLNAALQNPRVTGAATPGATGTSGSMPRIETPPRVDTPAADTARPGPLPPLDSTGNEDLLGGQDRQLPVPAGIEPAPAGTRIAVAFPNTGDQVEVGDSGASTQAFELSAVTGVNKSIRRFNFRVLDAAGTIVLQEDVCGTGTASATECGHNPRFSDFVDLSGAAGTLRLAVQALDSDGVAVSREVEFQVPYRAVITTDVAIADQAGIADQVGASASADCTWTVSGRLIDWGGNPVANQALFVEARRDADKFRARENNRWTDWDAKKWGAATTNTYGHFSLTSQELDHCGGEREFRVTTQVGEWNLNLGQPLLTREAAAIPEPLVLPRAETDTSFDIITYNVALIMGVGAENRQKRYRAETIGRLLHRYHVVVLNEAFRNRNRWDLIYQLKKTWQEAGYATTVVGDGRPAFDNGGVDIVTRLPVLEEHAMEYSEAARSDRLADKGAVHARVRAVSGQPIDIFATHLQAKDEPGIRVHQVGELRDFIRRHSDPNLPFLVLGDMNLKTPEERNNAIRILREARPGLRDAWQWRGSGACVTKPDSGGCLDFIYVGNVSGERPLELDRIAVRKFEDAAARTGYLSDHFGLEAGFTVDPLPGAPRPTVEVY